jgi:hypothetical protein
MKKSLVNKLMFALPALAAVLSTNQLYSQSNEEEKNQKNPYTLTSLVNQPPTDSTIQENYLLMTTLTNAAEYIRSPQETNPIINLDVITALHPQDLPNFIFLVSNPRTGEPEYFAKDLYSAEVMKHLKDISMGDEKIIKINDSFFMIPIKNTKIGDLSSIYQEGYLKMQDEIMKDLCKKVDKNTNKEIDKDEAYEFYEKFSQSQNPASIDPSDVWKIYPR